MPGSSRKPLMNQGSQTILKSARPGFTLMETMIAMMILAIALTVILQLFSSGLRAGKAAEDYTRAVFYAREKMEEILLNQAIQPGTASGEFAGGYHWQADIVAAGDSPEENPLPVQLLDILLIVRWGEDGHQKSYDLQTVALTPNPVR